MLRRKLRKIYYFFSTNYKKHDNDKTIAYRLKFIDSFRFMLASLSSFVDNLSEIYKKECKSCKERKKVISECVLIGLKNNRLHYK